MNWEPEGERFGLLGFHLGHCRTPRLQRGLAVEISWSLRLCGAGVNALTSTQFLQGVERLSGRLRDELNRVGAARWTDRGLVVGRQASDDEWQGPIAVELAVAEETGELVVDWDEDQIYDTADSARRWCHSWGPKICRDDGRLFDRFLEFSRHVEGGATQGEEDPEAVLRWVRDYGAFDMCWTHNRPYWGCCRLWSGCVAGPASVGQVCRLSAQARALLRLAARWYADETGDCNDWEIAAEVQGGPGWHEVEVLEDRAIARLFIDHFANTWLMLGFVWLRLVTREDGMSDVRIAVDSAMGAVARHLFLTVCRVDGIALCSGCGSLFVPEHRKPKRGQHSWCPACGRDGGYRAAKRMSAAKRRKAS